MVALPPRWTHAPLTCWFMASSIPRRLICESLLNMPELQLLYVSAALHPATAAESCGVLWVLRRMPLVLGGKWEFLLCPIPTPGGCTLCCVAGLAEWLYLGMPPTPIHRNISWTIRAPLQIFHFICVRAVTYDDECKCCTFRTFRQFCSLAGGISRLKVADPFAQFSATCWRPLSRYNAGELTSPFSEQLRQQLNGSKPLAFIPCPPLSPGISN